MLLVAEVVIFGLMLKLTYQSVVKLVESLLLARVCCYSGASAHIWINEVAEEHNHCYLRRWERSCMKKKLPWLAIVGKVVVMGDRGSWLTDMVGWAVVNLDQNQCCGRVSQLEAKLLLLEDRFLLLLAWLKLTVDRCCLLLKEETIHGWDHSGCFGMWPSCCCRSRRSH